MLPQHTSPHPVRTGLLLGLVLAMGACSARLPEAPGEFDPTVDPTGCTGKCDGATGTSARVALPGSGFATLFAPYEPALGLDLSLIDDVVAARAADPQSYDDGENPYRIRYAVYNLRNLAIVAALADAHDAGVDVQILIEKDQLDPARDWNTSDEFLVGRGFTLIDDHRDLDADTIDDADIVGIAGSGLMHLKARLYSYVDASGESITRLTTGSMNPGDLAVDNDETLHYLEDPQVIEKFQAKFEAVRAGNSVQNSWQPGAPLQVLFSPDGGAQAIDKISELIDAEDEMILLALYSVRDIAPTTGGASLVERLEAAANRGVFVAMVTDRKQSDGVDSSGAPQYFNDDMDDALRAAGIPVIEVINPASQFNAMHTKYGIFGLTSPVIVSDAGNWTRAGLGNGNLKPRNQESVFFIDSMALDNGLTARRYLGNFIQILRRYSEAPNRDVHQVGGVVIADLISQLQALPGWPRVDVGVEAIAETFFGQNVFLTGDSDALGHWTQAHLGISLTTDAASYPLWTGAGLQWPLGQRSECKLIKAGPSGVEWEAGGNRRLLADPTAFANVGTEPGLDRFDLALRWR